MEKYQLQNDLKVFGVQVPTFPMGIGEAFDKLVNMLPKGDERPYYGISQSINGKMNYMAAALETYEGEGEKYGCQYYSIEKGDYLSEILNDWSTKTEQIKSVIEQIIQDERVDRTKPAIEIYKNSKEMVCMVKMTPRKQMATEWDDANEELAELLASFTEVQLNKVPVEGSWTAGQVCEHLIKSNSGFAKLLYGPVKETERAIDELVAGIKRDFLDFNMKMESPPFVLPTANSYHKEDLLNSFDNVRKAITEAIDTLDLSQTCVAYEIPEAGYLTRTEALWFVIAHTQRHIHQLKNIASKMK